MSEYEYTWYHVLKTEPSKLLSSVNQQQQSVCWRPDSQFTTVSRNFLYLKYFIACTKSVLLLGTGTVGPLLHRVGPPADLAYSTNLGSGRVLIAACCAAPRLVPSVLCALIWTLATICLAARYTVKRRGCVLPRAERALPRCRGFLQRNKSPILQHTAWPNFAVRTLVSIPAL